MAKTTKGENAEFDHKYQYKKYTVDALASYFKVTKADVHETVDFTQTVMEIPLLEELRNFEHVVSGVHIDRKKLDLEILVTPRRFVRSTIYEEFLLAESFVSSGRVDDFLFCMHIGGMILVMYRDAAFESKAHIYIETEDDGGFVIESLKEFLLRRYPSPEVD